MAEEQKQTTFGPQPYRFGQDGPTDPTPPKVKDEPTRVENVSYDKVTNQGKPDNPKSAKEVVERSVVNVATPTVETTTTTGGGGADTSGSDRKIKTLRDFLDRLEPLETAEQRKERERREKSAKIVSAISDGIQAMSNLFFTSQYAPNMYDHEKGSGLNAQNAAIEKAKKERAANREAHLKYALAIADAEDDRAKTVRDFELAQERMSLAREKAQRERQEHQWKKDEQDWLKSLRPEKEYEQRSKANRAGYMAQSAQAKAGRAEELAQAEVDAKRAQASRYNSLAAVRGSNGNVEQPYAYDRDGYIHHFKKEETAEKFARAHGTWVEEEYDEVTDTHTEDELNGKKDVKQVKKKKRGYSRKPQSKKGAGYGDSGKGAGYGD